MTTTTSKPQSSYLLTLASKSLGELGDEPDTATRLNALDLAVTNIQKAMEREVVKWREAGASWSEVGAALGITKQGAQRRYGKASF